MKIDLPIRYGTGYVKFDKDEGREYGFEFEGNTLTKFKKMGAFNEQKPSIILPTLNEDAYVPSEDFDLYSDFNGFVEVYIKGNITIAKGCFEGIKEATIIVPFNTSIKFESGCFDEDADIKFIVPSNMGLKQIYQTFETYTNYHEPTWTILADKRIRVDLSTIDNIYGSGDYRFADSKREGYTLSISDKYHVRGGHVVKPKPVSVDPSSDLIND